MTVGVIGAGVISDIYLKNMISRFRETEVKAIAAAHLERAQAKAAQYGIQAMTVEELLADPEIEMVVNLTPVGAHYDLIRAALLAGKHVYTEKTVTDSLEKTKELAALAAQKGLYLGSAPDTFFGAALQTARKAIDDGLIGDIHSFAISSTRCNDFLLSLLPFLREPGAGIVCDYAVYYLTALVSLLGPVAQVGAVIGTSYQEHLNVLPQSPEYGEMMQTLNESQVSAIIRMRSGVTGTLHMDAETINGDEAYFAVYGRKGMLYLTDPNTFGGTVRFMPASATDKSVQVLSDLPYHTPYSENSRGVGPADMAKSIAQGRKNRANIEMALHVHECLEAILAGGEQGGFVSIESTCERPEPLGAEGI